MANESTTSSERSLDNDEAAAKALVVSCRSVQSYVHRGLLQARQEGEGVQKTFYVSIDSLNTLRDRRRRLRREAGASGEISSERGAMANTDETMGKPCAG